MSDMITERRVDSACTVVRLRARARQAHEQHMPTIAAQMEMRADREERRYTRLRAIESAELHSAARDIGWEVVG